MRKYRIVKLVNGLGEVVYKIQWKGWIFWTDMVHSKVSCKQKFVELQTIHHFVTGKVVGWVIGFSSRNDAYRDKWDAEHQQLAKEWKEVK